MARSSHTQQFSVSGNTCCHQTEGRRTTARLPFSVPWMGKSEYMSFSSAHVWKNRLLSRMSIQDFPLYTAESSLWHWPADLQNTVWSPIWIRSVFHQAQPLRGRPGSCCLGACPDSAPPVFTHEMEVDLWKCIGVCMVPFWIDAVIYICVSKIIGCILRLNRFSLFWQQQALAFNEHLGRTAKR